MSLIYWASPLFTDAQRKFNLAWVYTLRRQGHNVCLPQEFAENDPTYAPSSRQIFCLDTAAIMKSDLIVAVIDDETIDSGVASEIGIAHAVGMPIVGVYTDIRRHRSAGRMYKNLYVLGLIELSLGIVNTLPELLDEGYQKPSMNELLRTSI